MKAISLPMVSAAAAQGISQEEIEVRKGHRTRRAIGLALLFLLIASLLGLQLLTRRATRPMCPICLSMFSM